MSEPISRSLEVGNAALTPFTEYPWRLVRVLYYAEATTNYFHISSAIIRNRRDQLGVCNRGMWYFDILTLFVCATGLNSDLFHQPIPEIIAD